MTMGAAVLPCLGLAALCLALVLYSLPGQVQILAGAGEQELPRDEDVFNFGPAEVRGAAVFRQSDLSLAFVNKKPVVPGHVLIVPRRCVAKLEKLEAEEVRDLFLLVQEVERFLQRHLGVDSTTISIQSRAILVLHQPRHLGGRGQGWWRTRIALL